MEMHATSPNPETPACTVNKTARRGLLFKTETGDQRLNEHLNHVRRVDWASTSLGALESWPQDLTQLCHICLLEPQPRLLILGTERVLFYNQAYAELCGNKHPFVLGQPIVQAWGEEARYAVVVPLETAEATGRQVTLEDQPLVYRRNGFLEEVYLSWTVVPLAGSTPGFYVSLTDVTETTLADKRRSALRALDTAWGVVKDPRNFWKSILPSLEQDPFLFPFAFLYVASPNSDLDGSIDTSAEPMQDFRFKLEGAVGKSDITRALPTELGPDHLDLYSDLTDPILIRPGEAPTSTQPLSSKDCILCPIRSNRSEKIIAYLYLGTDPRRPYNDAYRDWINEFNRCLRNAVTSVLLSEEEKRKQHYQAIQAAQEQHLLAAALATRDKEALAVTDQYQRLLKVVDMANVGIFEFDLEGRLIYGNDAFRAMSGCPPDNVFESQKLVFLDLTYPEDTEYLMSKWNGAAQGKTATFEMRYKNAEDGVWVQAAVVPVMDNGVVKSVSGCTTNIHDTKLRETESKQRLQALEKARAWEQRFANFAEMAPIAIYFGSQNHQDISYCNHAWFEMTGHPVVPFEQIDWARVVYDEDIDLVRNNWERATTSEEAFSIQFRLRRSWVDGNGVAIGPVWVTASALPEYNSDGTVKGIIGTMLDISALKFAETVQQMKVHEAMEAKRHSSNFIDMTSHEIRNPLGAVFHCSDAVNDTLTEMSGLADRLASTSEHEISKKLQELIANAVDSVNTIISCSQHQKRIVDDILVLSKLDSNLLQIVPSSVKVTNLLRDVEKMFETEAHRRDVQLTTEAHASLEALGVDWAMLDPGRVQQVLINLVTNAIKFCKKKRRRNVTIRVGASKIRPSENVLPSIDFVVAHSVHDSVYDAPEFASHSFYLWFSVEDTGRGMSADEKSRIFARFSQGSARTETEYGGSGLGLFISRELSELQGGEIGVASELNVGSTFAFFIQTRHAEPPVLASALDLPLQLKQKTSKANMTKEDIHILVVEDNAVNAKVLCRQLAKHDYSVSVADNGLSCLEYIRSTRHWRGNSATAPAISVILMDSEMPKMDGLTATKMIRQYETEGKLTGHIPVISVSANARQEQMGMALEAGMDDSISKPFRIADLVPKIERLAGWT